MRWRGGGGNAFLLGGGLGVLGDLGRGGGFVILLGGLIVCGGGGDAPALLLLLLLSLGGLFTTFPVGEGDGVYEAYSVFDGDGLLSGYSQPEGPWSIASENFGHVGSGVLIPADPLGKIAISAQFQNSSGHDPIVPHAGRYPTRKDRGI